MYASFSTYHTFHYEESIKEFFHSEIIRTPDSVILKSLHNAGFFSCCSTKLDDIIEFFNKEKSLPDKIDSSTQFSWYKNDENSDITYNYFKNPISSISIPYIEQVLYNQNDQFRDYRTLPLASILPFIKKYFSPSNAIIEMKEEYKKKYNVDKDHLCVLFYRGNDKNTETVTCSYEEIINYGKHVQSIDPQVQFMIQSDETEFIERMEKEFKNSFVCRDEIRHMNKQMSTVDIVFRHQNYEFSKKYLALTLLMAESKYLITGSSGNCSIWIIFYREHCNQLYQFHKGKWLTP